ncbi:hypothetical protein ZIOFF_057954 [Zingiber officinale]|uniref:Clathrin/coatomer adaptor adaptin-like N-terminal domain-containing protein n=1 Tax=Zingiber officinale TaxID=94328 RepID=A0A8J5KHC0_ZINOF|nr:hypothetical protein ZIOFF_057954 [Zingiber officinale]
MIARDGEVFHPPDPLRQRLRRHGQRDQGSSRCKRRGGQDRRHEEAVMLLLNGETLPQLFITIVRYVLPSEDHTVQKLLLLYLEIIGKTDAGGRVLPEMILICQNLRNNLQHPNKYIRGVTLRFLCRLSEPEILDPLVPSVLSNLEHRHPFCPPSRPSRHFRHLPPPWPGR